MGSAMLPHLFYNYFLVIFVTVPTICGSNYLVTRWDDDTFLSSLEMENQLSQSVQSVLPIEPEISTRETPYENCGGSESFVESVEITPCDPDGDNNGCEIQRGQNVTFRMSFTSNVNSKTLQAKIYGVKDFIPVPLPCPQPNACQNSGLECPILKGHKYNYSLEAPVLLKYPKMSLKIKGELKDDRGNILACVEIPIKLV